MLMRAVQAKSSRNCQCLDVLPLVCRQTLLPLPYLHLASSFLPRVFCSLLVMKSLACLSLRKCAPAVLEEIFDLRGKNLNLGSSLPQFKGLYIQIKPHVIVPYAASVSMSMKTNDYFPLLTT